MNGLASNLLAAIYAGFLVVEFWVHRPTRPANFSLKNARINIGLGVLSGISDLLVIGLALLFYQKMERFALFHLDYSWQYWLLLFLGHDLLYWVMHFCEHRFRVLWAVHFTHHSCLEMNLSVAIRSSVFQPVYRYFFYLPLVFVGFHGADVILMWLVANTWVSYVHTESVGRLGFLENFLVTPSVHRVHHSSRAGHLDKNFGIVLSVWDRLFGTFSTESIENPARPYGLTTQSSDFNFQQSLFYEWKNLLRDVRSERRFLGKIARFFERPGSKV